MKDILFATNNLHKLDEIRSILLGYYNVLSLADIYCAEELPETQNTLRGNALQKAFYVFSHYKTDCFADDTGLEIDALNGAPGVYSARFAGEEVTYKQNRDKVLDLLKETSNRKARFVTVIALILNGKEYFFEGTINGVITEKEYGDGGFGYDSIFLPDGYKETFAQMPPALKNGISHRGLAVAELVKFLKKI